jgi:ABC-2 type transport system ATP-binding protein
LLDEPTVGVDPQSREHLMQAILKLKEQGTAVIYTTHYMEEAERLCDQLAIIDHGKVIASGTSQELRQQVGERDLILIKGLFTNFEDNNLFSDFEAEVLEISESQIRLLVPEASKKLTDVLNRTETNFGKVSQVSIQQANLESLFIKLTGRALRDAS